MGNRVGYFTGDNLRLLEDAQILKPVYFPSVPRVLNRVYASASMALLNGGLKGTLLKKAIDAKTKMLHDTGSRDHLLWDRLVFRKVLHVFLDIWFVCPSGAALPRSSVAVSCCLAREHTG